MKKLFFLFSLFSVVLATSCKVVPPSRYLSNISDSLSKYHEIPELKVQNGDVIAITVFSDNPAATAIFNQSASTVVPSDGGSVTSVSGMSSVNSPEYVVQRDGTITMHGIGKVPVSGLSIEQIDTLLRTKFSPYLTNPHLVIKMKNFRVSVLGEVLRPGVIPVNSARINVLEAISLAGDLTLSGLKEDIIILRDNDGQKEYGRIDVTKVESLNSPYFYLKQNDIVIVNPNPKKPGITQQQQIQRLTTITAIVSVITSVALVVSLFQ